MEAHKYLDWDFQAHKELGLQDQEENVWSRERRLKERYIKKKMESILSKDIHCCQEKVGEIQQLLRNTGRNILITGKKITSKPSLWHLVVGSGSIYISHQGSSFKDVIRDSRKLWLEAFEHKIESDGLESVMDEWFEHERRDGLKWASLGKEALANMQDGFDIEVNQSDLPVTAVQCYNDTNVAVNTGHLGWRLWVRTSSRKGFGRHKAEQEKKKDQKLVRLIDGVSPSCTLSTGWGVNHLNVVGEREWEEKGEEILERAWAGTEMWPFISLDCEGAGIWYQIAWYGKQGLDIYIFGPGFFPIEMMILLESRNNFVIGRSVHDELGFILGRKSGWLGLDLAVVTRDLQYSDHVLTGLGELIRTATGQSVDKVKHPKKYSEDVKYKYGYIRVHNWSGPLDGPQLLYAAFDVVAPHIIMYDYMLNLLALRAVESLDERVTGFESVFKEKLKNLVDRQLDPKKQHVSHAVPVGIRDLETSFAALDLSKPIEEFLEGLGQDLPEERRLRMYEQIKVNGEEMRLKEKKQKVPKWMRHPGH